MVGERETEKAAAATARRGEKGQVARDSAWNFGAAAATALCSGLRSLLLPKLLPTVDAFGILNFLNLFKAYSPYANGGVLMGYGIEVPHRRGSGQTADTAQLEDSAYTFSTLATLAFALGMLLLGSGWLFPVSGDLQTGLLVFAVVVLLQNLLQFYSARLRVELNFKLRSQQEAVNSLAFTAVAVGGAAWFGLRAVFAGLVLGELLALWWTRRHDPYRPAWRLVPGAVKSLLWLGIPVTVVAVLNTFIFDVDIILIKLWFPGFHEVGLYGLGVTVSALMMMVPYTAGHALAPRIFQEAGKPAGERDLLRYIRKPMLLLAGLAALGSGATYLLLPPVIKYYLPNYLNGLPAMRLLVWYSVFMAAISTVSFVFIGMKKFARFIALQLLVLAFNIVLNLSLLAAGYGITGVAAVTLLSYALFAVGAVYLSLQLCAAPLPTRIWCLLAVAAIAIVPAGLALLLDSFGGDPVTPGGSLLLVAGKLAAFIAGLALLALLGERQFGLLGELRALTGDMLARRVKR